MKTLFIGDLNAHTESKSKCDAFIDIGWDVTALSSEKIPHLPGLGAANGFRERLKRKFFPMHDANRTGPIAVHRQEHQLRANPCVFGRLQDSRINEQV